MCSSVTRLPHMSLLYVTTIYSPKQFVQRVKTRNSLYPVFFKFLACMLDSNSLSGCDFE